MNRRARLGMMFTLALAVLPASGFAQAAAESVLLNSSAAAATAKTGKAFQSASDRVGKRLAGRVQRQVSPSTRKTPPTVAQPSSTSVTQGTASHEGTTSPSGPMIASIQGAQTTCTPSDQKDSTPGGKTATGAAQKDCGNQNSPDKARPEKHPSVITVSFSK